jgi:hypothetical protein
MIEILAGHGTWVPPVVDLRFMNMEKVVNPLNVSGFGVDRHMAHAHQLSDLVQEFRWIGHHFSQALQPAPRL